MTDPVAIYAALVGSGSLGWQVWRERNRLSTKIRVEFEHGTPPRPMFVVYAGDTDRRPEPLEYELTLVVINDGETTEYVRDAWIEDVAGTGGNHFDDLGDEGQLPPRARVSVSLRTHHVETDFSAGFVGVARLASGRLVQSKVEHLDAHLLEHIETWNRTAKP